LFQEELDIDVGGSARGYRDLFGGGSETGSADGELVSADDTDK
jgi:hypothetical protein